MERSNPDVYPKTYAFEGWALDNDVDTEGVTYKYMRDAIGEYENGSADCVNVFPNEPMHIMMAAVRWNNETDDQAVLVAERANEYAIDRYIAVCEDVLL